MTATAVGALFIILIGWVIRRAGVLGPADGQKLVQLVIWVTLPALVLHSMITTELDAKLILAPVVGFGVYGVLMAASFGAARLMRLDRPSAGALIAATTVGNTGFFGIPLIAASGPHLSVPAAIMYDVFCTGILTWTSTIWVGGRFGDPEGEGAPRGPLWKNLLLPPTWALALGLALNVAGVRSLPDWIDRPLVILGGAVLPLVLIYAGLVIEWDGVRRAWREVGASTLMRLALAPLAGFAIAIALQLDGDVLRTVVLMSAMPTAMMSLVIGGWFKLRTDVIAGAVVASTLLATVALPVIRGLL